MMTEGQGVVCDLCGDSHSTSSCTETSQFNLQNKVAKQEELQLAYQSLPSWVELQEGVAGVRVVVKQRISCRVKLGPLVAPHTSSFHHTTNFPLKIYHESGGHTYLDLSRKWLCNWLSLIRTGSPTNRNLLACQIDDLLYYVSTEEIPVGSELVVWYAPFYQQKVQRELQELGNPHSLVGSAVVTQRNSHRALAGNSLLVGPSLAKMVVGQGEDTTPARNSSVVTPILAKIVVGLGEITYTYRNVQQMETDCHFANQLTIMDDKCVTGNASVKHISITDPSFTLMIENSTQTQKFAQEDRNSQLYTSQSLTACPVPRNQQVPPEEDLEGPDYVVRLTVTAAPEGDNEQNLMDEESADDLPEAVKSTKTTRAIPLSHSKRRYKKLNGRKPRVCVAGSDLVRQLPPRALGARNSGSWNCNYCGRHYSSLLTFTRHLKAHLLWLVGRCHVCRECGTSMSSLDMLQRHVHAAHPDAVPPLSPPDSTNGEEGVAGGKLPVNPDAASEVEDEEEVDDPDDNRSHSSLKRISALPTKPTQGPHNCQICPKRFHKPQYLLRHLRKHSGDFTCRFCLKVFARKEGLQKHLCPARNQNTRLSCSVCNQIFLSRDLLHQHHLKHQEAKKCERCGWKVTSLAALQQHMTTCPSVQVTRCYQCEVCGKQVGTVKQLETHMTHHRQKSRCDLCNKPYSNNFYLARHQLLCRQSHQLSSVGHVSCADCGKEFTDATAFRTHYHTHTHPFRCSQCNHRFQTRVAFEVHICEVEHQCDKCGVTFRSLQALSRHSAVHGPPPHSCRTCRRSYYRKESLEHHICSLEVEVKDPSQQEESHPCNVCGALLANIRSLTAHQRSAHGQFSGKLLTCEICNKEFHRRDLLLRHQAVHEPPSLPCSVCHKLFKTQKSLEVHTLIHLNIKRFICKYCNKKFHQKVNLIRHEKSHMPRGTVKCQYCAINCSSTEELKGHLLSHTLTQSDEVQNVLPQEDLLEDTEASLPQGKVETQPRHTDGDSEVLLPQFAADAVVEPQLKFVPETKGDLGTEQSLCGAGHLLATDSSLDGNSEGLEIIVKERIESAEMSKDCQALVPEFRTKVVHSVVPVMASELTLQAAAVPHPDVGSQTTVFLPQRISNFSLAPAGTPLAGDYLVPAHPDTAAASPHHVSNSSVFKVTNGSVNSECQLPSNVLITSATVPPLEVSEDCHLDSRGKSQEEIEREQEVSVPPSDQTTKVRHLTLTPGTACLYQPTSAAVTGEMPDCHMLSEEEIVQSVVLVGDPPVTNC